MFQLFSFLLRLIDIYSVAIVIYALLSWFPGGYDNPVGRFLAWLCEPYINLFRRLRLNFAGLDFSVLLAAFSLQIIARLLVRIYYIIL
ncbi:YggT family protein [Enterococcus nangangensis]